MGVQADGAFGIDSFGEPLAIFEVGVFEVGGSGIVVADTGYRLGTEFERDECGAGGVVGDHGGPGGIGLRWGGWQRGVLLGEHQMAGGGVFVCNAECSIGSNRQAGGSADVIIGCAAGVDGAERPLAFGELSQLQITGGFAVIGDGGIVVLIEGE